MLLSQGLTMGAYPKTARVIMHALSTASNKQFGSDTHINIVMHQKDCEHVVESNWHVKGLHTEALSVHVMGDVM